MEAIAEARRWTRPGTRVEIMRTSEVYKLEPGQVRPGEAILPGASQWWLDVERLLWHQIEKEKEKAATRGA